MPLRTSVPTNKDLLARSQRVLLAPARGRAVFWHGDVGQRQSELFIRRNPGHTRLDELMKQSPRGTELLAMLDKLPWEEKEEIWWDLSRRLARAASGDVHCFGTERLTRNHPVAAHRSRFCPRRFADTTFEKVELPELENNPLVEVIYYNNAVFK